MASNAPETGILLSYKQQNLPWKLRLGKFIDNSFDAKANSVSFVFGKKELRVRDDGDGCPVPLGRSPPGDGEASALVPHGPGRRPAERRRPAQFRARYRLTDKGRHAAEYGEYDRPHTPPATELTGLAAALLRPSASGSAKKRIAKGRGK